MAHVAKGRVGANPNACLEVLQTVYPAASADVRETA